MLQKGKRGLTKHSKKPINDTFSLHYKDLNEETDSENDDSQDKKEQNLPNSTNLPSTTKDIQPMTENMSEIQANVDAEELTAQVPENEGLTSQLSHVKDVVAHPLMPMKDSSEDDDLDDFTVEKKRALPPPRPPRPKIPPAEPFHEKISPKSTLSSVLFDQKSRTQFISSLKKNIQHYTQSSTTHGDDAAKTSVSSSQLSKGDAIKVCLLLYSIELICQLL